MTATNYDETMTSSEETDEFDEQSSEQQHAAADSLVRQYTLGGMAVGLVPVPIADLVALVAVQLKMLHGLARIYGIEFKADLGRSAVASLAGSGLSTTLSPTLAASLGKIIPGIGQTLSTGSAVILNGAVTYAVGKVFIQHFAAGGTFLTFNPEAVRDYFETQIKEGSKVAADLKKSKAS